MSATNNQLKNRKKPGTAIDNELLRRFKELSAATMIPQSKLMDEAIKLLLKKYESK